MTLRDEGDVEKWSAKTAHIVIARRSIPDVGSRLKAASLPGETVAYAISSLTFAEH